MMTRRAYYFGCIRESGHYLWTGDLERIGHHQWPSLLPWPVEVVDTGLCPKDRDWGSAQVTHKDGWTALSFWDWSVDTRPGSHSTFLFRDVLDFDAALARARELFPTVFARLKFEVKEC